MKSSKKTISVNGGLGLYAQFKVAWFCMLEFDYLSQCNQFGVSNQDIGNAGLI